MHIKTYLTGAVVAGAVVVSAGTALAGSQPDAPTVTACANPSGLLKLSDAPCARNEQTVALATGGGLSGVSARLDALEGKVTSLQSDNADLRTRVAAIESDDKDLKSANAELKGRVASLEDGMAALKGDNADLKSRVGSLETDTGQLKDRLAGVTRDGDTLRFSHMNVQIVNGRGDTASANGLGNLIVGYNANRNGFSRAGSHNLVVGDDHGYSSYGGLVAGSTNRIQGPYASVTGGDGNIAEGIESSVSGGLFNIASGFGSSVSGGNDNEARGPRASVTGGAGNVASGDRSTVNGGTLNTASGFIASVVGGRSNVASNSFEMLPAPTGASGLAGYQLVSSTFTVPGWTNLDRHTASCPAGTKVLGGGAWLFTNPNSFDITPKMIQSAAIDDDTWEVKIDNAASARSWDYSMQLTCAPTS